MAALLYIVKGPNISTFVRKAYFKIKVYDQIKSWVFLWCTYDLVRASKSLKLLLHLYNKDDRKTRKTNVKSSVLIYHQLYDQSLIQRNPGANFTAKLFSLKTWVW